MTQTRKVGPWENMKLLMGKWKRIAGIFLGNSFCDSTPYREKTDHFPFKTLFSLSPSRKQG